MKRKGANVVLAKAGASSETGRVSARAVARGKDMQAVGEPAVPKLIGNGLLLKTGIKEFLNALLKSVKADKFGERFDSELWLIDHNGQQLPGGNVVANLVSLGWATPWNGKGAKPVPAWPRPATA